MIKISKDVFNYPEELTLKDIRLLVYLCEGNKFEDLNCDDKMKIANNTNYSNSLFENSFKKLINLKLLNENGVPIINNKEYTYVQENLKYKNMRQLFVGCIPYWGGNNVSIVKIDVFKTLFGKETRITNQNWNRVMEQTGYNYTWKEKLNKIYITYGVSKDETEKKREYIKHSDYIKSEHWKETSAKFKEYFGKCQLCSSTKNLQVHHNNYENLYKETDKDLIVLCQSCHAKFHGKA